MNGTYRPYKKPDDNPMYNNKDSNHPPSIKKQTLKSIIKTISKFSSKEEVFNNNVRTHSDSLKKCGFQEKPVFVPETPSDPHGNETRKYRRKISWFNPPYAVNITEADLGLLQLPRWITL